MPKISLCVKALLQSKNNEYNFNLSSYVDDFCNLLIYLLISNLNFEIIKISYTDKIIDNNNILTTNKIIKNMDLLNESSIKFLENFLVNIKNCVKIDKNDFL